MLLKCSFALSASCVLCKKKEGAEAPRGLGFLASLGDLVGRDVLKDQVCGPNFLAAFGVSSGFEPSLDLNLVAFFEFGGDFLGIVAPDCEAWERHFCEGLTILVEDGGVYSQVEALSLIHI